MLSELISQNTKIKIYGSLLPEEETAESVQLVLLGSGAVHRIISNAELELVLTEEFGQLQKNVCYLLHVYMATSLYRCSVYYHSGYEQDGEKYVCVELVSPFERLQRRMHERVSCHSKIHMQPLTKEEALARTGQPLFENCQNPDSLEPDTMIDISGGGIRFTTKQQVEVGEYLSLRFEILTQRAAVELNVVGQAVYFAALPNAAGAYDVRIKYIGISEKDRREIIRFVFRTQREEQKKSWK